MSDGPPVAGDGRGPGDDGSGPGPAPADRGKGAVRIALSGLTTRGRSFVAAGLAAGVCAYVLGQEDLLRVGLLLAVLPLIAAAVLYRTRYRVAGSRRLSPSRVVAGEEARVQLRMENVSRLPTGLLMLQDHVPYVLGPRPRFVLDRMEAGGRREVSYRVRSDLRGRYPLGPLQLRLTDPFGLCELTRSFSAFDLLTVVPRTEELPPVRLTGDGSGHGDGRLRSLALAGDDDLIPRPYRHGDDLRRVHWRSTARFGELMVRREEQPRRARCTVLLDTRAVAYQGSGPGSAFEWAVSGAASVLTHLAARGFAVRLITDEGGAVSADSATAGFSAATGESADSVGVLMDLLAVVDHSEREGCEAAYEALREPGGTGGAPEGLLVAFVGDLDHEQAALMARMRRRSATAVVFLLDSDAWQTGTGGVPRERLRVLREAGWTALAVPPGASLAGLWQHAGRERAGSGDVPGLFGAGPAMTSGGRG